MSLRLFLATGITFLLLAPVLTAEKTDTQSSVERGKKAVRTVSSPLAVTPSAYTDIWKQWGLKEKPADFEQAFRDRYGLQQPNDSESGPALGIRETSGLLGTGLAETCLMCHAGSIAGQTIIGLGNASLDFQSLIEDIAAGETIKWKLPFKISNGRGVIEATAGSIYLYRFRNADMSLRIAPVNLELRDDLNEDIPAWWLRKRKKTMFHTGSTDARSVRANLSFLLAPINSGKFVKDNEVRFADIKEYILSLEAPKYPFEVDKTLAKRGKAMFE